MPPAVGYTNHEKGICDLSPRTARILPQTPVDSVGNYQPLSRCQSENWPSQPGNHSKGKGLSGTLCRRSAISREQEGENVGGVLYGLVLPQVAHEHGNVEVGDDDVVLEVGGDVVEDRGGRKSSFLRKSCVMCDFLG